MVSLFPSPVVTVLIVIGAVMLIVVSFGDYGACNESRCALQVVRPGYFLLSVFLLLHSTSYWFVAAGGNDPLTSAFIDGVVTVLSFQFSALVAVLAGAVVVVGVLAYSHRDEVMGGKGN